MNYDLSILIPARNEEFLSRTVEDLLKNKRGNTEVIVVLDGAWANPPITSHKDLKIVYLNESIGQRAATNLACRLSSAKYIMKIDAHCTVEEGFDTKMMDLMQDDYTMVPVMRNLHAFDWVCKNGHRRYQSPSGPCKECGESTEKDVVWRAKESPRSTAYLFDSNLKFGYWGAYKKKQKGDLVETMSLQGSCFMLTREKYWELDICDEGHGGWGQQGTEVACKTWLSGGRVVVNMTTWYAHMFRTQGGDFGFPYPLSGRDVKKARDYSRSLFMENNWKGAKYPLSWLLEKFAPVPFWHEKGNKGEEPNKKTLDYVNRRGEEFYAMQDSATDTLKAPKVEDLPTTTTHEPQYSFRIKAKHRSSGIIYYTDNKLKLGIAKSVQKQLENIGLPIVSASLKPMSFGTNIHIKEPRGYLTMAKQILAALETLQEDVVFFCEHDVLYHPSHFDFIPTIEGMCRYNTNVWRVRAEDGHALWCDDLRQLSGLSGLRHDLVLHYRERVAMLTKLHKLLGAEDFNRAVRQIGFEPGTHNRVEWEYPLIASNYQSKYPNIDIRHAGNLTPNRWDKDQFRNSRYTKGWTESTLADLPGWDLGNDTFQ